jgi:hypothetical protein
VNVTEAMAAAIEGPAGSVPADPYLDAYAPLPPGALPATGIDLDDPTLAEIPPGSEPVATGTLFIMIIFLMLIGALWGSVYFMLLNR